MPDPMTTPSGADRELLRKFHRDPHDTYLFADGSDGCYGCQEISIAIAAARAEGELGAKAVEAENGILRRNIELSEKAYLAEHGNWGHCKWRLQVERAEQEVVRLAEALRDLKPILKARIGTAETALMNGVSAVCNEIDAALAAQPASKGGNDGS